ncbi:MAG: shikimate kinase [Rhodobacteraceae bacterium]|nr:shikimate kinase [Paracoccaceae bacterium]
MNKDHIDTPPATETAGPSPLRLARTVTLVGLMGAGKSAIGRRLAASLQAPFIDADDEIVKAAGMTIPEIFERLGEPEFRAGERRVIHRLLRERPQVVATGGGAFMDPVTRGEIGERAVSVWLKVDLDTLVSRVSRRNDRPLLRGVDPREKLAELMRVRDPVYATADVTIVSRDAPHEAAVRDLTRALMAVGAVAPGV